MKVRLSLLLASTCGLGDALMTGCKALDCLMDAFFNKSLSKELLT